MTNSKHRRKILYAVVGLGHIAQVAVLPAFAHVRTNSQLVALVSGDPEKLRFLENVTTSIISFLTGNRVIAYAAAWWMRFILLYPIIFMRNTGCGNRQTEQSTDQ